MYNWKAIITAFEILAKAIEAVDNETPSRESEAIEGFNRAIAVNRARVEAVAALF